MHVGELPIAVLLFIDLRLEPLDAVRLAVLAANAVGVIGEDHDGAAVRQQPDVCLSGDQIDFGVRLADPAQQEVLINRVGAGKAGRNRDQRGFAAFGPDGVKVRCLLGVDGFFVLLNAL